MIVLIIIIALIMCYINHKIRLEKEKNLFEPLGQIVEVNGNKMSVYVEGKGDTTLVFMSGGGTCSPILDFKSLYSLLSDEYRIVVIEKLGYGFSDIVNKKRDINTILQESRSALKQVGIEDKYVLLPHSMSGIEALYWSEQYPEEVLAIIGLDMAVPSAYSDYKINISLLKLGALAANIGITRFIPGVSESDAIKYGTLSEEEKEIYRAIFYRRTGTSTMINEAEEIKSNATIVEKLGIPNVPILMFSSNGEGTGYSEENWRLFHKDYIEQVKYGKLIELNCSHYVHNIEYNKISIDIKKFLNETMGN